MSTLTWVVGAGGLLGSHVVRPAHDRRGAALWEPGRLPWIEPAALDSALAGAAKAFVRRTVEDGHDSWELFWCAGAAVVGTPAEELVRESRAWERLLDELGGALARERRARHLPGRVFFASSAGAVYGGGSEGPLTEASPCRPISAYGEAKLRQERALDAWALRQPHVSTLVARISNLYGPGQRMEKPQGLISHMSRCVIHRQPLHIYVPLDTIRDYVFAEDAARAIVRWVDRLAAEAARAGEARRVVKICAAEEETTISALIGVFRRMAKRELKVITGLHAARGQQPGRLRFRSRTWTDEPRAASTGLLAGIHQVHRHQLALFQSGALPFPRPPA